MCSSTINLPSPRNAERLHFAQAILLHTGAAEFLKGATVTTESEFISKTPEYRAWSALKRRCYDPNDAGYKNYGGRGIFVHPDWINSFDNFLKHIGPRPSSDHSIDRINNDGNYEPGNVRWATQKEQNNNKRSCRFVVFRGETLTLRQLSESPHCVVDYNCLMMRLRVGWSGEKAATTPAAPRRQKISFDGKSMTAREWAVFLGIKPATIRMRIHRGLPVELVLSPVKS